MKAFWWFEENSIAGMARPGFNRTRWFDFSYEEAVLLGFLGQFPSGKNSLADFQLHVNSYGAKIFPFYPKGEKTKEESLAVFSNPVGLKNIFEKLSKNAIFLEGYELSDTNMQFEFSKRRLVWEIDSLKAAGIQKIVSLTERHNSKDELEKHFEAVHFAIDDMDAPKLEQVQALAAIVRDARAKNEKIAVHCLAGIGRTSTMLIGAHMILGESLDNLRMKIAKQNPVYVFAGRQAEFLRGLAEKIASGAKE